MENGPTVDILEKVLVLINLILKLHLLFHFFRMLMSFTRLRKSF